jgi:hypothetical protein
MNYDLARALQEHKEAWEQLIEDHSGNPTAALLDDRAFIIGETLRAAYVLDANAGTDLGSILQHYAVDRRVQAVVLGREPEENKPRKRREDPVSLILEWSKTQVEQLVSTAQIAEAGGVSRSTALNIIDKRPDVFIKRSRGQYEVRDPQKDREQARKENIMEKKL